MKLAVLEDLTLTPQEKAEISALVIQPDDRLRSELVEALRELGIGEVSATNDHLIGKRRLAERDFSHVLFSMRKTSLSATDFLSDLLLSQRDIAAIAVSDQPDVEEVFELLVLGARGYLLEPFANESLESTLAIALKGKAIPDHILHSEDRNQVLVEFMANSLDNIAEALRAARSSGAARKEVPKYMSAFRDSVALAKTFRKGGDDELLQALEEFCLLRSEGPASKLGRVRQRLRERRKRKQTDL